MVSLQAAGPLVVALRSSGTKEERTNDESGVLMGAVGRKIYSFSFMIIRDSISNNFY